MKKDIKQKRLEERKRERVRERKRERESEREKDKKLPIFMDDQFEFSPFFPFFTLIKVLFMPTLVPEGSILGASI